MCPPPSRKLIVPIRIPINKISMLVLRRLSRETLPRYTPNTISEVKQRMMVHIIAVSLSAITKNGNTGMKDPIKLEKP